MFAEIFTASAMSALFQVIMIDLVLAGDNAIVIGLAAAGLPKEQRAKVIFIGIAAATLLRIGLALITTQLLGVVGLLLAGGILLLWVSWKMWRELKAGGHAEEEHAAKMLDGEATNGQAPRKTLKQAVWQIIVADFSMSLDNVLAVGGAAREHPWVLVFGLALSIALMALAASWIARLLQKYMWIGYVGLVIIVYVALEMIWRGWNQVEPFAITTANNVVAMAAANGISSVMLTLGVLLAAGLLAAGAFGLMRKNKV
jgi:YjbE family integral membrane protein